MVVVAIASRVGEVQPSPEVTGAVECGWDSGNAREEYLAASVTGLKNLGHICS